MGNSNDSSNHSNGNGDEDHGASSNGYTFKGGETQLLRICIDAMHTAGLAFIVQGISTMLLGVTCTNLCMLGKISCSAVTCLTYNSCKVKPR